MLENIPDQLGPDVGHGLGDDWQVQFFCVDNPLAAIALDPDGDGAERTVTDLNATGAKKIYRVQIMRP